MENASTARTDFAAIAEECEQDFTRKLEATEDSFLRDSRFNFLCNADGETPFRTNRNEKGLYDLILDTKDEANRVLARNLSPASAFACMAVAAYFIERETTAKAAAPAEPETTEDGRTLAQVVEELGEVKEEREKLRDALKSIREKVSTIEAKLREAKYDAERAGSAAEDAKGNADDAEDAANDAASEAEDALEKSREIREELAALSF